MTTDSAVLRANLDEKRAAYEAATAEYREAERAYNNRPDATDADYARLAALGFIISDGAGSARIARLVGPVGVLSLQAPNPAGAPWWVACTDCWLAPGVERGDTPEAAIAALRERVACVQVVATELLMLVDPVGNPPSVVSHTTRMERHYIAEYLRELPADYPIALAADQISEGTYKVDL